MRLDDILLENAPKASKYHQAEIDAAVVDIQHTAEFKAIIDEGFELISSPIQLKRGVLRLQNVNKPSQSYTLHANGDIRGENTRVVKSGAEKPLKGGIINDTKQSRYKQIKMPAKLLDGYKLQLEALAKTIENSKRRTKHDVNRKDLLNVPEAESLGELNLPTTWPVDLDLSRLTRLKSLSGSKLAKVEKSLTLASPHLTSFAGSTIKSVGDELTIWRTGIRSLERCPTARLIHARLTSFKHIPANCDHLTLEAHANEGPTDFALFPASISSLIFYINTGQYKMSCRGLKGATSLKYLSFSHHVKTTVALDLTDLLNFVYLPRSVHVSLRADVPGQLIILKYAGKGHDALLDMQAALIDAGLDHLATL